MTGTLLAVDDHHDLAAQDDAHLLVRMGVLRDDRAGVELDEIEHRLLAEEGARAHAVGEREVVESVEPQDARFRHGAEYVAFRPGGVPGTCSALRNAFAVPRVLL